MSRNSLSDKIEKEIKKLSILSAQSVNQSEPYSKFVSLQAMLWVLSAKMDALLGVLDKKYGFDQGQIQIEFVKNLEVAVYTVEKALGIQVTDELKVVPGIKLAN